MKYKILAVDDNPINLKLLARTLVNSNYLISTAATGREALRLAREVKPDLILLDVMLPDLDGYEVCRQLQGSEVTKSIPVIFLSAKNESVDKARGLALGAVDYLTKPFDSLEINARVRTHLSIRKTNIKLLHEKQGLQNKLREISERYEKIGGNHTLSAFFDKHTQTDFNLVGEHFEFASKVIYKASPPVVKLIPLAKDKTHLFSLLLNGFEKNYSTLYVLHLFEDYIRGFLDGLPAGELTEKNLLEMIKKAMDKFSPDIYDIAFTFALSHIQLKRKRFSYYSFQEGFPLIIDADGQPFDRDRLRELSKSHFDDLLQLTSLELPQRSSLFFSCLQGKEVYSHDLDSDIQKQLSSDDMNINKAIALLSKTFPAVDNDRLIAGLFIY